MRTDLIKFKGNIKEGLNLEFNAEDFDIIISELEIKLKTHKDFYEACRNIYIVDEALTDYQKETLEKVIMKYSNMAVNYTMREEVVMDKVKNESTNEKQIINLNNNFPGIKEDKTLFVTSTMRSGQNIVYDGSVIIFGDVNPGAEITATGNILVYGYFRGIAHAGCNGNKEAVVFSTRLKPIQLRIADLIAISPDEDFVPDTSEIARIVDEQVVIESYL